MSRDLDNAGRAQTRGEDRWGAEVESPARVEETCVPLLTSLTSRFRGRVRCVWVQCKGDIAVTYREEMKAWAIRVNWEFFDHGENGIQMYKR